MKLSPFVYRSCWQEFQEFFNFWFKCKILNPCSIWEFVNKREKIFISLWSKRRKRTNNISINVLIKSFSLESRILKGSEVILALQQDSQNWTCSFPVKSIPIKRDLRCFKSVVSKCPIRRCHNPILLIGVVLARKLCSSFSFQISLKKKLV